MFLIIISSLKSLAVPVTQWATWNSWWTPVFRVWGDISLVDFWPTTAENKTLFKVIPLIYQWDVLFQWLQHHYVTHSHSSPTITIESHFRYCAVLWGFSHLCLVAVSSKETDYSFRSFSHPVYYCSDHGSGCWFRMCKGFWGFNCSRGLDLFGALLGYFVVGCCVCGGCFHVVFIEPLL